MLQESFVFSKIFIAQSSVFLWKMFVIFRRMCNKQEKLIFQWGHFSFFFQSEIANSLYSKTNAGSGIKTTTFRNGRSGFESPPYDFSDIYDFTQQNSDTPSYS